MASRSGKFGSKLAVLAVIIAALTFAWHHLPSPSSHPKLPAITGAHGEVAAISENHYSPAENLEQIDIDRLSQAHKTIDIAMYAFTDKYLAQSLVDAARRGVRIRIYRDQQQFQDEQRHGIEHGNDSTTAMLSSQPNVSIRVKSKRELMHMKAYVIDGALLRDGSANWSPSGLKRQDNNAHFTTNRDEVEAFQQAFDAMWTRDNTVVQ